MRSKHELSHAFVFAAAAESARKRVFRAADTRSARGFRATSFRKRSEPTALGLLGTPSRERPRDAVFAAIQLERQARWMRTQLERMYADDALIRRLCGKRSPPP